MIASGGMATVHLARAHGAAGFERLVALKVMHPHIASEPEFVGMFLDEARLAARIHHPNVVGTSDVQQDESGLFLVMDYIDGPALQLILRELWKRGRNVPLDVALRIFLDALAGLHAAHELTDGRGEPLHLVHRDVSPQNILVGVDGVARLTDFGVARARSRLTTTGAGQLKGKLTYMAPEHVRAEPIDRRADIYAAGVVLWEMLAGERMMRCCENDAAVVERILSGVTRSPRCISPSVPEPIANACMRALCFEPDDRYPTAAAFAEALEAAAQEACVVVASTRAVSAYIKQLNLREGSSPELRVQRAESPTLPESADNRAAADRPTLPEAVTPHGDVMLRVSLPPMLSGPRLVHADRADREVSSVSLVSREASQQATRVEGGGEGARAARGGRARGLVVSAGVVAVVATVGALLAAARTGVGEPGVGREARIEISGPAQTVVPSLDPPSAVAIPSWTREPAERTAPAPASPPTAPPKTRSGDAPAIYGVKPPPSPTTFRPREL